MHAAAEDKDEKYLKDIRRILDFCTFELNSYECAGETYKYTYLCTEKTSAKANDFRGGKRQVSSQCDNVFCRCKCESMIS